MRGVPKNGVILEMHSEQWKDEFGAVRAFLKEIHGSNIVDIQHVGSTAIEGIVAKPMLDIAMVLNCLNDDFYEAMAENQYIYYGEVAHGKHLFIRRGKNEESLQHVHCYAEKERELFDEQIRFRDFLRSHTEYAREYEKLKVRLCELYANDRRSYTAGKQAFFDKIKELAQREKS